MLKRVKIISQRRLECLFILRYLHNSFPSPLSELFGVGHSVRPPLDS